MYHRVTELERDPFRLAVTPERFDEQLEQIRSRFEVLRLSELARAIEAGELPRRAVVVTFDDGYRDNLLNAKPLLERYEIPATVFVTAGQIGSDRDFWWDELVQLCAASERFAMFEVWDELRQLPHAERTARLDSLWKSIDRERPTSFSALDEGGVRELARGDLIEIGGHTVTHPRLSTLSASEQRSEIQTGKERLEQLLGKTLESFAYPYGDRSAESIDCVRDLGFICACVVDKGTVKPGAGVYTIQRYPTLNWPGHELARRLERLLPA